MPLLKKAHEARTRCIVDHCVGNNVFINTTNKMSKRARTLTGNSTPSPRQLMCCVSKLVSFRSRPSLDLDLHTTVFAGVAARCWSQLNMLHALFLFPGSNPLESIPRFCPSCFPCQFFEILLDKLFLQSHCPKTLMRTCVCVCARARERTRLCLCRCVSACVSL